MTKKSLLLFALLVLVNATIWSQQVNLGPSLEEAWTDNPNQEHPVTILLKGQFDFESFEQKKIEMAGNKNLWLPELERSLKQFAKEDQSDLMNWLVGEGIKSQGIKSYWIENAIFVDLTEQQINQLKNRNDIAEIHLDGNVEVFPSKESALSSNKRREIGLEAIGAPFMWRMGYTGYGRKIFIIDSGVEPFHPALQRQNAWNNYPIQDVWIGVNDEGFTYDCEEHGTHVLGIACGLDRNESDTIGVAFNAEWLAGNPIGCFNQIPRNDILDMFQWSLNPDGDNSTTDDVPDVINNSWGDFSLGFCSIFYRNSLAALENADIAAIFSAGNLGPGARTLSPPGNLELSEVNPFTVGAVNSNQIIADFSSRGPSRCNVSGSFPIKPEVCAPGVSVRSSIPDEDYASFDGTSMASPHVAGAYVLLKEAFPTVSARVIKEALYFSAVDLGPTGEDNDYGNGMISLERAFNYLTSRGNTASNPDFDVDVELWDVSYNAEGCNEDYGAQVLVYNGGKRTVNSIRVQMRIEGTPAMSTTNWSGTLAPGQKRWISLEEFDSGAVRGNFTIRFTITDVNNSGVDDRPLNNQLKRPILLKDAPNYDLTVQDDFGDLCLGSRVAISVSNAFADIYDWYDELPLLGTIGEGKTYTPELTSTSNAFYVLPKFVDKNVGLELPESEDANIGFRAGVMEFEVFEPIKLRSFDVQSDETGRLSIRFIREEFDTVYRVNNFPIFNRAQTIPVNASLPTGTYKIEIVESPRLVYVGDENGLDFPFSIENVVSITGGSPLLMGKDPYYYFFNWTIDYDHPCGYKEVIVETNGSGQVPTADFNISTTTLDLEQEDQIDLENLSTDANSYLWQFGDGISSNEVSPSHNYTTPGRYSVSLIARSSDNCTDATSVNLLVTGQISNTIDPELIDVQIYPNPTTDVLHIQSSSLDVMNGNVAVYNSLGEKLNVTKSVESADIINLDFSSFNPGVYYIQIQVDGQSNAYKVLKFN